MHRLCALVVPAFLLAGLAGTSSALAQEPAAAPAPAAATEPAPPASPQRLRLALGGGALYVPAGDSGITALAVDVALVFPTSTPWETRLVAHGYSVDEEHTKTTGAMVGLAATRWWSVYGFGFGSGLGYAKFEQQKSGGWDDDSLSLAAYLTPVALRFGDAPRVELTANVGAIRFFSHDVRPWGFVGLGFVL